MPIPPKIQDEQIEPTVTIREEEERMIEEYRLNGQIYMVKVTPKGGIPYYYIDTDGDGKLELDMDQQALNPVQPVHWKVKEWDRTRNTAADVAAWSWAGLAAVLPG